MQEQQAMILAQQNQISNLTNELDGLKTLVEKLTAER
jgi:hypothetical protein